MSKLDESGESVDSMSDKSSNYTVVYCAISLYYNIFKKREMKKKRIINKNLVSSFPWPVIRTWSDG